MLIDEADWQVRPQVKAYKIRLLFASAPNSFIFGSTSKHRDLGVSEAAATDLCSKTPSENGR